MQIHHKSVDYIMISGLVLSLFVLIHWNSISDTENYNYYTGYLKPYLKSCQPLTWPDARAPLKLADLCISEKFLGNEHVLPFLFSFGVVVLSYLLTFEITKSYPRSILVSGLLLCSTILGWLGPTASFSAGWAFYFMASMYTIHKRPEIVGILFFMSIASKGITFLLLPIMIWYIFKAGTKNKERALVSLGTAFGIVIVLWAMGDHNIIQHDSMMFDISRIDWNNLVYVFRSDPIQYVMLPVSTALLATSRHHLAKPILAFNLFYYSLILLLPIFSVYGMFDYRMIPQIVFMAIGVSLFDADRLVKPFKRLLIN